MSKVKETIIAGIIISAIVFALELEAVYVYTGGWPW